MRILHRIIILYIAYVYKAYVYKAYKMRNGSNKGELVGSLA